MKPNPSYLDLLITDSLRFTVLNMLKFDTTKKNIEAFMTYSSIQNLIWVF